MSLEENKAIELRFFEEVVNKGNLAVIDELVAANFVQPDAPPGTTDDREAPNNSLLWPTVLSLTSILLSRTCSPKGTK